MLEFQVGIKIRENASEKGMGARAREVRKYKELGYEEWCKQTEYGMRWPSSEVIFKGVKGIFGEFVTSHKKKNMYKEAKLKFWAYQQLKNIV